MLPPLRAATARTAIKRPLAARILNPRILAPRRLNATSQDPHHDQHDHHEGPTAESFPKGFYISLASLVAFFAFYKYDHSGDHEPLLTRLIAKYHTSTEFWEARNALHTELVERAAVDRSLLLDAPIKEHTLEYPEAFNMGSAINLEAGWASGDLEAVKRHLEKTRDEYVPKSMREGYRK